MVGLSEELWQCGSVGVSISKASSCHQHFSEDSQLRSNLVSSAVSSDGGQHWPQHGDQHQQPPAGTAGTAGTTPGKSQEDSAGLGKISLVCSLTGEVVGGRSCAEISGKTGGGREE